jgi:hypothetical protein
MSTKPLEITRRNFLKIAGGVTALGAFGLLGYSRYKNPNHFPGSFVGANSKVGHLIREGVNLTPQETRKIHTAIVGGGMAGLSAAWWLKKNNYNDFVVFEMDQEVGGNSRSGSNSISKYPWGAHYVPLPGPEAHYVRELFEEIGIIKGYQNGLPVFDEYYLCADPHERLFFQGQWQEGLVPQHGIQAEDKLQYDQFFAYVESLKNKKGKDGKPLFNIPLEESSRDPDFIKLDQLSMSQFMASQGWKSQYLNYCCRDDYGVTHDRVSAWAGLHYFASRAGTGYNADSQTVITWPEGNGFIVGKLKGIVGEFVQKNSLVYSIKNQNGHCEVDVLNTETNQAVRYEAQNVIYCGPRFTARKVIKDYSAPFAENLEYAPWLVANVSVDEKPAGTGAPLSWDNVSYYSKSLGYIVATHQDLVLNRKKSVLTYYLPLDEKSAREERIAAYQKSFQDWLDIIVPDLEKMHPGISKKISNIDIWIWGHGMISPGIDYLWSDKRQEMLKPFGRVHFAHTDMSGVSIFEEAQYRGVEAAKSILQKVKRHEAKA